MSLTITRGSASYVLSMPDLRVLRAAAVMPTTVGPQRLVLKARDVNGCVDQTGVVRIVTVLP